MGDGDLEDSEGSQSENDSQPSSASNSGASTPLLQLRETNRLLQQQLEADRLEMIAQEKKLQDIKNAIIRLEQTREELIIQRREHEVVEQTQASPQSAQQQPHQQQSPTGSGEGMAAQAVPNVREGAAAIITNPRVTQLASGQQKAGE